MSADYVWRDKQGRSPTRGLLGEGQAEAMQQYADRFGRVRMWHIGGRIGVLESSGGLVRAHAEAIVRFAGLYLDHSPRPIYAFCNWLALDAYTPDVRKALVDWQLKARYDGVYVAHTSTLLSMAISMTNLVLPNDLQVCSTLEALDRTFETTLAKVRGVQAGPTGSST